MPQVVPSVLASVGITGLAATAISTAVTLAATYFVSSLLRGGPPKPDASEREVKSPKPPRIHVLGQRRVQGSSALPLTATGTLDVAGFSA
jgi:hypothetical protein